VPEHHSSECGAAEIVIVAGGGATPPHGNLESGDWSGVNTGMRILKDFASRSPVEQESFIRNTWCDKCQLPDLGLTDPVEYEEDGACYIEGRCRRCRVRVVSKIHEKHE
jgi:hypothetical protein